MNTQPGQRYLALAPRSRRVAAARQAPASLAQRLSLWSIGLFLAAAFVREVLGQSEMLLLGDFNLHSVDPAIVVGLAACAAHGLRGRLDWRAFTLPIMTMAALIAINFLRGVAVDPFPALLSARANGSIAVLLVLAVCIEPTAQVYRVTRAGLIAVAMALVALAALRLTLGANLLMTSGVSAADANDGGRALSSFGTFVLVLASGLLTSDLLRRRRFAIDWRLAAALLLPVAIVLSRQATAMLAEFVMLAALFAFQRGGLRPGRVVLMLAAIAIASAVVIVAYPYFAGSEEVYHRAANLGTRTEVWQALWQVWPTEPLGSQLIGLPAGQMPELLVYMSGGYRTWTLSMHSMYFGALPMMGYVGALSYLALLAIVGAQSLLATMRRAPPFPAFHFAFCLATAVLSYSYEVRADSLLGLFVAIVWLRAVRVRMAQTSAATTPAAKRSAIRSTV